MKNILKVLFGFISGVIAFIVFVNVMFFKLMVINRSLLSQWKNLICDSVEVLFFGYKRSEKPRYTTSYHRSSYYPTYFKMPHKKTYASEEQVDERIREYIELYCTDETTDWEIADELGEDVLRVKEIRKAMRDSQ